MIGGGTGPIELHKADLLLSGSAMSKVGFANIEPIAQESNVRDHLTPLDQLLSRCGTSFDPLVELSVIDDLGAKAAT
jgi:hypothetical protein